MLYLSELIKYAMCYLNPNEPDKPFVTLDPYKMTEETGSIVDEQYAELKLLLEQIRENKRDNLCVSAFSEYNVPIATPNYRREMSKVENSNINSNIFVFNEDINFLCKAKTSSGEWVIGYFTPEHVPLTDTVLCKMRWQKVFDGGYTTIQTHFVKADSLCRCIGAKDINDDFIFGNDYVKHYNAGIDNEATFSIGRVFFDKDSLSWKRTVDYEQINGQRIVKTYIPPRKTAPSVQMSANHCDYEVIGNAFDESLEKVLENMNVLDKLIGGEQNGKN